MKSGRKKTRIITASFAAAFSLFVAAEIALKILGFPTSYSSIYRFDETLGYRYQPGTHKINIAQAIYEVKVDPVGIVDRYGEGHVKTLILGDGVIAGIEHRPEQQLAHLLGSCTGKSTVNLAVPGYGTVQQLIALEQWIKNNDAPEKVLLVYNTTNDYFDNIQNWESNRIPSIRKKEESYEYILPKNPNKVGEWLRLLSWNSRLYTLIEKSTKASTASPSPLPEQQKWLFSSQPPVDSAIGDRATRTAAKALQNLATEHNFEIQWLIWRDLPAEEQSNLNADIGLKRLSKLLEVPEEKLTVINGKPTTNNERWEKSWLHPGTRHSNKRGLQYIAKLQHNKSGAQPCR